jgi:hypothetical protein
VCNTKVVCCDKNNAIINDTIPVRTGTNLIRAGINSSSTLAQLLEAE